MRNVLKARVFDCGNSLMHAKYIARLSASFIFKALKRRVRLRKRA
jgi:hypothetical protein